MKKQTKQTKIQEICGLDTSDVNFKDFFSHLNKDTTEEKPEDFEPQELEKGTRDEHEHTDDDVIAQKIAMDHLEEDPKYYSNLEKCKNGGVGISAIAVSSEKSPSVDSPHITGDIDGTPINKTISTIGEGGSEITEPNAGITSDMKKDGKPTRWSIDAYPSKGKITPKIYSNPVN